MKPEPPHAFSPQDLARRRKRAVIMALCLVAMMVLFYITTIVRLYDNVQGAGG
jgi:hypothetical protein